MEKRKNNKGFSLVELIVVVAIMAVLMTVLAPQLLRYVERSRLQKDNSAIGEIVNAIKIAAADENINAEIANKGTAGLVINIDTTARDEAGKPQKIVMNSITDGTKLAAELALTVGTDYTTGSTAYASAETTKNLQIVVVGDADNGTVAVTVKNYITAVGEDPADKAF